MRDRVRKVMEHFKLTQKQFANELCVAEATISSIYKGRTAPTNNLIQSIHQAYPGINISWLMFGEGEMLLPLSAPGDGSTGSAAVSTDADSFPPFGQNVGFNIASEPSLFDANTSRPQAPATSQVVKNPVAPTELKILEALTELKNANQVDKPVRKIKEIRVFYDDGTFEAFVPSTR